MHVLALLFATLLAGAPAHVAAAVGDCGQPASEGAAPTASDALFALRAATGAQSCELCVCDVDDSGGVSASDALRILRRAVGQTIDLLCPACSQPECEAAEAPACGGTCTGGRTCAPDPLIEGACGCFDECEISDAPTCGGSCDFALPLVLECTSISFGGTGEPVPVCRCLPPGLSVCGDAEAPTCGGACQTGTACADDGGTCGCEPQPAQGPCESAAAPACGGTCPENQICADEAGACACVELDGREETCVDSEAPACGGACASGRTCAVEGLGGCSCVEPCEISEAPACGGACTNAGDACTFFTVNLGGATTLELCECRPAAG